MKANLSRDSHRPAARFSGVRHEQGGLVVDADLNEQAEIARARTDGLGVDAVAGGVPATGGAVHITASGMPALREGTVYAEGVRGLLAAAEAFTGAMGLYAVQTDFPLAPPLPASGQHVVVADLWDRPVSAVEDALIADPALHGAGGAHRTRTMVQIKIAPAAAADAIASGTGAWPRIGTATLAIDPSDPDAHTDPCNPCADLTETEIEIANTLFRLEVVGVEGAPDTARRLHLAWSAENASAVAPVDVDPEAFARDGAVYEYFSAASEAHMGAVADLSAQVRSAFSQTLGPSAAGDAPFVRRWDGMAVIDLDGGSVATRMGSGFDIALDGDAIVLSLEAFSARLTLTDSAVLRGDYWLVEMRRFAPEDRRIRLVSPTPVGIRHHYAVLFGLNGSAPQSLTPRERRALSFPALSDLPASHVGFENACEKLYGDAETVQDALDSLCGISAADIAFDPEGCPRLYAGTTDVQAALDALCRVDFSTDRILRHLFDWGVVCGIGARRVGDSRVVIDAGVILDGAGRLSDVPRLEIDLNTIGVDRLHFDRPQDLRRHLVEGTACLALAVDGEGQVSVHLADRTRAFAASGPDFETRLTACIEASQPIAIEGIVAVQPTDNRAAFDKIALATGSKASYGASGRLTTAEARQAASVTDAIVARFEQVAPAEQTVALRDRQAQITAEFDPGGLTGAARETRLLQRESARLDAVLGAEEARLRACLCNALVMPCPDVGTPPHLVPIACLRGEGLAGQIRIAELCLWCCRKTALSWRRVDDLLRPLRRRAAGVLGEFCCPAPPRDGAVGIEPNFTARTPYPMQARLRQGFTAEKAIDDGLLRELQFAVLGQQPEPTAFKVTPAVGGLTPDRASAHLAGNGIAVVETIEVGRSDIVQRVGQLSEGIDAVGRLFDDGALQPGDRVALLTSNGVVRDVVKVETGRRVGLFERDVTIAVDRPDIARPDAGTPGTDTPGTGTSTPGGFASGALTEAAAIRDQLESALGRARDAVESVTLAETTLDRTTAETAALREEIRMLTAQRVALTADIAAAQDEIATARTALADIGRERAATEATLAVTRRLMGETEADMTRMLQTMRTAQPVAAIREIDDALAGRLAGAGVLTVGDLAAIGDLTPARVRTLATRLNTDQATLTRLAGQARDLINRNGR